MNKGNIAWILALFGTAVGAGILFLPISAGIAGILVLLIVTVVSIPTVFFAHRNIGMIMCEAENNVDYTGAVNEFMGLKAGFWVNVVFFITLLLLLIVYSSGLNNDFGEFLLDTGITSHDLSHSPFLSLLILGVLIFVIRIGEGIMLRFMGLITFLLVFMLLGISAYLIPQWDFSVLTHTSGLSESFDNFLLLFPIFILSFSFYPAMSSMIIAFKNEGLAKEQLLIRNNKVILASVLLLFFFIMFFVISCILSLSHAELENAYRSNLSILTVLAEKSDDTILEYSGPIISQLALITSFIGTFLGARESVHELLKDLREVSIKKPGGLYKFLAFDDLVLIAFLTIIWVVTILNLPILDILGEVVAPPIAFFLIILPVWITYKVKRLRKYRSKALLFTMAMGFLMLFSYVMGKML